MLFLCFLFTLSNCASNSFHYEDFGHWNKYEACQNKKFDQSPIDIKIYSTQTSQKCPAHFNWYITNDYDNIFFTAVNNGHTLKFSPVDYSHLDQQRQQKINMMKNYNILIQQIQLSHYQKKYNKNRIAYFDNFFADTYNNRKFVFDSMHIHFGNSEHLINGKHYEMELHFVHYSSDFPNIQSAIQQAKTRTDQYSLGVIGVFVKVINDNKIEFELDKYINSNGYLKKANKEQGLLIKDLDLTKLFPSNRDFFAYTGSLTTPPCNPIVRWHVFKNPIYMSQSSFNNYANFYNLDNKPITPNHRPAQINKATVYQCNDHETYTPEINELQNNNYYKKNYKKQRGYYK